MSRILLLEDEPAIADTLLYTLRSEGFEVTHVQLARDALASFAQQPPDLAILDVGVPDGNGFDVCRAIRKTSELPIVFLTARNEEIDRILGLELGADDYVSKPFSPREVCARVKAILRRTGNGKAAERGAAPPASDPLRLDEAAQRIACGGDYLTLTRYEYLLLRHLMQHPNRVFAREQLLDAVWGQDSDSTDRTVDTHIKTLRAKLRAVSAELEPIQTHRGLGYSYSPGNS